MLEKLQEGRILPYAGTLVTICVHRQKLPAGAVHTLDTQPISESSRTYTECLPSLTKELEYTVHTHKYYLVLQYIGQFPETSSCFSYPMFLPGKIILLSLKSRLETEKDSGI